MLGLAAASVTLAALAADDGAPACGLTDTDWRYGEHQYDYLEVFEVRDDGSGSYVLGYGQAVREDMRFTYRVDGDRLVLRDIVHVDPDGTERPRRGEIRARFTVTEGDHRFRSENPYDGVDEYRYRCELALRGFTKRQALYLYGDRVEP